MKGRLNLTIDNNLLENIKKYASKEHTSVSELVENYFKAITNSKKRRSIIDIIEQLDKPLINQVDDLKDLYYQDNSKKHGL